ncbi:MAG: hypothetical protein ACM3X4_00635 [Ignavibacteriales bacterium]
MTRVFAEEPGLDGDAGQRIALGTYGGGLFRRCPATPVSRSLVYIPYWIGPGALRLKSAFSETVQKRLFACDGWKGVAGAVEGTPPEMKELERDGSERLVPCRVPEDEAKVRIREQAGRLARGKVIAAGVGDVDLRVIHKPFWAVLSRLRDGRMSWRLVAADSGIVTYRFDLGIEEMLRAAGLDA